LNGHGSTFINQKCIADIEQGHYMLGSSYLLLLEHLTKVFIARVLIEACSAAR